MDTRTKTWISLAMCLTADLLAWLVALHDHLVFIPVPGTLVFGGPFLGLLKLKKYPKLGFTINVDEIRDDGLSQRARQFAAQLGFSKTNLVVVHQPASSYDAITLEREKLVIADRTRSRMDPAMLDFAIARQVSLWSEQFPQSENLAYFGWPVILFGPFFIFAFRLEFQFQSLNFALAIAAVPVFLYSALTDRPAKRSDLEELAWSDAKAVELTGSAEVGIRSLEAQYNRLGNDPSVYLLEPTLDERIARLSNSERYPQLQAD